MGVYYQIANYDKRELIDLYAVTNIKRDAFSQWSLQTAILNTFLGFSWPDFPYDLGTWVGRWKRDRIQIQYDAEDESDERDEEQENWPDAGMMFLAWLDSHGWIDKWMFYAGWHQHWQTMNGTEDLRKWIGESRSSG